MPRTIHGVMTRLAWLAGAYLIACAAGGIYATDQALHRPRVALTADDGPRAETMAAALNARLTTVTVTAADGTVQHGWLVTPSRPTGDAVLLFHGIASNRAGALEAARFLVAAGYTTLLADLRAHGESEGEMGTFGVREAGDARRWLGQLGASNPDGCLYLFGTSLGAAVAISAGDAPRVCAVVADSPYSSLRDVAYDRLGQRLGLPRLVGQTLLRPGIDLGFLYARWRYGVALSTAAPAAAVARPGVPVLIIHGALDDNLPPAHAERLRQAGPDRITLWIVPGAGHGEALGRAGDAYRRRVLDFLAAAPRPVDRQGPDPGPSPRS